MTRFTLALAACTLALSACGATPQLSRSGGGGGSSEAFRQTPAQSQAESAETVPGETHTGDAEDGATDNGVDTGIDPISG
jgi:hypothetical protein